MLLFGMILLNSCAIHKDFPYICFRWGCFAKQVGLPSGKAIANQIQVNSKIRKKRRENNRRKKSKPPRPVEAVSADNSNQEKIIPQSVIPSRHNDTTRYTLVNKGNEHYLLLIFICTNGNKKDSLLLAYPEKGDEITGYEKQQIRDLLNTKKGNLFEKVIIKDSSVELQGSGKSKKAKKQVAHYLVTEGINEEIISYQE